MKHFRFILIVLGTLGFSISVYMKDGLPDFIGALGVMAIICSTVAYFFYD